jgi:hypothetical protein
MPNGYGRHDHKDDHGEGELYKTLYANYGNPMDYLPDCPLYGDQRWTKRNYFSLGPGTLQVGFPRQSLLQEMIPLSLGDL